MAHPGVLLIDHGDLPSLAATTLEWRPHHVAIYHHRGTDPAAACRQAAVARHGEALASEHVVIDQLPPLDLTAARTGAQASPGGRAGVAMANVPDPASLLIRAATAATSLGCRRILWPRQVGPEPDPLTRVVRQADAAATLADLALDEGGAGSANGLVIDVPLVDLDDVQLVEVAEQGGAAMKAFWPCQHGGVQPCDRCDGCHRWRAAFQSAHVPWPW